VTREAASYSSHDSRALSSSLGETRPRGGKVLFFELFMGWMAVVDLFSDPRSGLRFS